LLISSQREHQLSPLDVCQSATCNLVKIEKKGVRKGLATVIIEENGRKREKTGEK
jgi:hypothetical protein